MHPDPRSGERGYSVGACTMRYIALSLVCAALFLCVRFANILFARQASEISPLLEVGFAEADITPALDKKPVYIAGFGKNRKAAGVHDPLMARAVVLSHDKTKIAIVSVDLVGLFHPFIEEIRR